MASIEGQMRLGEFILANVNAILCEWEAFARSTTPGQNMTDLALRDHAPEILRATVRDMQSLQSKSEQSAKSRGESWETESAALNGASVQHAIGRLDSGFDLLELVSEYRALRASVLRLWQEGEFHPDSRDVDDVTRFNESIDQSLTTAVRVYTQSVEQSRDLFLAILGHDLRNPLNIISMSAALLPSLVQLSPEAKDVVSQITTNSDVMVRMISDLLDYMRARLRAGIPVSPAPMDLGNLCEELFKELRTAHPNRRLNLKIEGDLRGRWDADRLRQAITNLLGNAIQHSPANAPIEVKLWEAGADVVLAVRNGGPAIPPDELVNIFEPLVRGSRAGASAKSRPGSMGLGLYIARLIAHSHGGKIDVSSSEEEGTVFSVRLPRDCSVRSVDPSWNHEFLGIQ